MEKSHMKNEVCKNIFHFFIKMSKVIEIPLYLLVEY